MRRPRLALFTTAYPAAQKFLKPWYDSVRCQIDLEFDVWMGVDSMTREEVESAVGQDPLRINMLHFRNTAPSEIRQRCLSLLTEKYWGIVLTDCDDILLPTRVQASRDLLQSHDLAGCALRIIDAEGHDLGMHFGLEPGIDPGSILDRYNVFGLSNTAYLSSTLRRCLPIPTDCVLIDWLLATRAWTRGARLYFDPVERMAYRQYDENVAPVIGPATAEQVRAAVARVLGHYECLMGEGRYLPAAFRPVLEQARSRALQFNSAIADEELLARYVEALNRLPRKYIWWWSVAHPELEHIWKR